MSTKPTKPTPKTSSRAVATASTGRSHGRHAHSAPAKVYRTPLRIMAAVPMPGLEPEDITVEVAPAGQLILRGQRRGDLRGIKDTLLNEWSVGDYYREVTLPAPVDGALANVTYGNGVLVVALPIAPRMQTATLTLAAQSPTHGVRPGHMGKPIRPYARP